MPLVILAKPAGMWKQGCQSLPPASSSSTVTAGILAQPVGQHAAGRAGAGDDVVGHGLIHLTAAASTAAVDIDDRAGRKAEACRRQAPPPTAPISAALAPALRRHQAAVDQRIVFGGHACRHVGADDAGPDLEHARCLRGASRSARFFDPHRQRRPSRCSNRPLRRCHLGADRGDGDDRSCVIGRSRPASPWRRPG